MRKFILLLCATLISAQASADVLTDFDGLGDNKELLEKAKALNPEVKVQVVQDRIVNRRNRFEISPEIGAVGGGNPYIDTFGYGANLNFHITPRWSVGVKYTYFTNELNKEGENLISDIATTGQGIVPEIDQPKDQYLGTVSWYPIYGKLNFFNKAITHFDVYTTAGYGNINLKNGSTSTWTAGGGVAFWFSQHLSARFEARYQTYQAKYPRFNQTDDLDTVIGSFQIGVLL